MKRNTFIRSLALTAGYVTATPAAPLTAPALPEMPLPSVPTSDWLGAWLGLDWIGDSRPIGMQPVAFRRDVLLSTAPVRATVRVSASPTYLLWVNGQFINQGPIRAYTTDYFYDEIDLLPYLKQGQNHLAVLLTAPTGVLVSGLNTRQGFILDGAITTADQVVPVHTEGDKWWTKRADWYAPPLLLASLPTGFQEHATGQSDEKNWQTAPPDASWQPPFYLGPAQTPPWKRLNPRPVPLLTEQVVKPTFVWRGTSSRTLTDWHENLAVRFNQERVEGQRVTVSDYGAFDVAQDNVLTFDFGKTRLIRPGVDLQNVQGDLRVEFYYALELEDRPGTMVGFGSSQEGFVDTFRPALGNGHWMGITARGCRFLTLKITGTGSGELQIACRIVDYQFPANATLTTADPFMQAVWKVSDASIRSSSNDVFVDTCSRENNAWSLDSCHQGKAAFYTFGETKLWRRSLLLVMQGIDEAGVPHAVNPAERTYAILFDQTMQCVGSCWDYYMATADVSLLREAAPAITRLATLCEQHITTDNLFVPPAYSWHWVDWAAIERDPYSLPVNCLLTLMAESANRIAGVLRNQSLQVVSQRIATRLRPALARFYDAPNGRFHARIEPTVKNIAVNRFLYHDKPVASNLHGNVLACTLGIGSLAQRQAALRFVVSCLTDKITPQNQFGPGWTDTLLSPVIRAGYVAEVIKFLDVFYGGHLRAGAPTWGEGYVGETDPLKLRYNTAHGWGAVVNSLIAEQLVGLQPLAPGWRKIAFEPHWPYETPLHYTLNTPAGMIAATVSHQEVIAQFPKGISFVYQGQTGLGTGKTVRLH